MVKQELDYLDRLFIEHYKGLKARKDIVIEPYEPDKQPGILQMDYDTKLQHIHITLKFNKKNSMYNFRSEKHYQSIDQDKAYDFAKSVAVKYDGFRCNAYDDVMIIQHVGTYRDMRESDAIAVLKQALETFESTVMTELSEFEKICEAVSIESTDEPSDLAVADREEAMSEYDIYELPEVEGVSITDSKKSDDISMEIDELLASFGDNNERTMVSQYENHYVLDETLAEISIPQNTVEAEEITLSSVKPKSMKEYICLYLDKKGIKNYKQGINEYISTQYYDGPIRYHLSYHEDTGILKVQLSKKYDGKEIILEKIVSDMNHQVISTLSIRKNILLFSRTVEQCTPVMFDRTMIEMNQELSIVDNRIQDTDMNNTALPVQDAELIMQIPMSYASEEELMLEQQEQYRQWDKILKEKEEFLDGQKKEILDSLDELNHRSKTVQEKEEELYVIKQQQEQLAAILNKKDEEIKKREAFIKGREDSCTQKESALTKKFQELSVKEKEISEIEKDLKIEREQNDLERHCNEKAAKELEEKCEAAKIYVQQMQIKASSLNNQIRLLEKQKKDVADILKLKTQLIGGQSVDVLERQLTQLQQMLSDSQNMLQKKDDKILSLEQTVKSQEARLLAGTEKEKLQQDVRTINKEKKNYEDTLKEYRIALEKAKIAIERLKEENADLKAECDHLHNVYDNASDIKHDSESSPDKQQDYSDDQFPIGITAEDFMDYICKEKGAKPEMLEELHAEDGTLVRINGNIQILVSFKSGMNFVECVLDKRANSKNVKKMEEFNDEGKKAVIFATTKKIICRVMFHDISVEEIYHIMEESADVLAGL